MSENVKVMAEHGVDLPPELRPEAFPQYLLNANNPVSQFDSQIKYEYMIMKVGGWGPAAVAAARAVGCAAGRGLPAGRTSA